MPARLTSRVLVSALLGVLVAGCGAPQVQRFAVDAPLTEQCRNVPGDARRVSVIGHDGVRLGAALLGKDDAPVGLVVNYGRSQTLCDWLPEANRLAGAKVKVLIVDRRGTASSEGEPDAATEPSDVYVAGRWLSDRGTRQVAILGSSLGSVAAVTVAAAVGTTRGKDVLGFAPAFSTSYCALVAISPALSSQAINALAVDTLPPLWMATETGNADISASGDALVRRARSRANPLVHELRVDTSDHSIALVERHREVQNFVASALDGCVEASRI